MELIPVKCPCCGGNLNAYTSIGRAFCEYCGSNYFLEKTSQPGTAASGDNPIGFRVEKDDTPSSFYLVMKESGRADGRSMIMLPKAMNIYMSFISGVSYVLGKNYMISAFCGEEAIDFEYDIDQRKLAKALKSKYDNSDVEFQLEEKRKEAGVYSRYFDSIEDWLSKHAFESEVSYSTRSHPDRIRVQLGRNDFAVSENLIQKYKCMTAKCKVTPGYFQKYCPEVYSVYERIRDMREIQMIAHDCAKFLNPENARRYLAEVYPHFILFRKEIGFFKFEDCYARFHTYGMENAPDKITMVAIFTAVFEKICELTKKENRYMWDLGDGLNGSGNNPPDQMPNTLVVDYCGPSYDWLFGKEADCPSSLHFSIKGTERIVNVYKKW